MNDDEPLISNPNLYPHGRCPACGHGVNWAAECPNSECTRYVPGTEKEEE